MDMFENDIRKIQILKILREIKKGLSLNSLRKELKTSNFNAVKRNCIFLEKLRLIEIEKINVSNNVYNSIKITKKGIEILDELCN
jgi:repressor of nif and glnA expression